MTEYDVIILKEWFKGRPKWMQCAAAELASNAEAGTHEDIERWANLCLEESKGKHVEAPEIDLSRLITIQDATPVALTAIHSTKNVNALAEGQKLDFSPRGLTVIYGDNGSGKSGYVRLLKTITGSRYLETILPNVFAPVLGTPSCVVEYVCGDIAHMDEWNNGQAIQGLASVVIFDSKAHDEYSTKSSQLDFEPLILSFLQRLADRICRDVEQALEARFKDLGRVPAVHLTSATPSKAWFDGIVSGSVPRLTEIDTECSWTDNDKTNLEGIIVRLNTPDPVSAAQRCREKAQKAERLHQRLLELAACYSDGESLKVSTIRTAIKEKEIERDQLAQVFDKSPLQGVGDTAWRELWAAALTFSRTSAYPEYDAPVINTGSGPGKCVLCHQPLSKDAQQLFAEFDTFFRGEAQSFIDSHSEKLNRMIEALPELPDSHVIDTTLDAMDFDMALEERALIIEFVASIRKRRQEFIDGMDCLEIPDATTIASLLDHRISLLQKADDLMKSADPVQRSSWEVQRCELESRKKLHDAKTEIARFVNELGLLKEFERAKKLLKTNSLTTKASELSQKLLTVDFQMAFQDELNRLGAGHLKVSVAPVRQGKAKVAHQIVLSDNKHAGKDASIKTVLSEGERRIVCLAGFLAEQTMSRAKDTIIFDDPITSLDVEYEDAVTDRLITLSKDRAVIVFTHRLSLFTQLYDGTKDASLRHFSSITRTESGAGWPVRTALTSSAIKGALTNLLNTDIVQIRKKTKENKFEDARRHLREVFADFRVILEKTVEDELLNGIIKRFRRKVTTDNAIYALQVIDKDDCDLIQSLMSKYSFPVHSQPNESPRSLPTIDVFERDVSTLHSWRSKFEERLKRVGARK